MSESLCISTGGLHSIICSIKVYFIVVGVPDKLATECVFGYTWIEPIEISFLYTVCMCLLRRLH